MNWILAVEVAIGCLIMGLIVIFATGDDKKNLRGFRSYPKQLQELLLQDEDYKDKIKVSNPIITFISNTILFLVIIFIFGIFNHEKGNFLNNFLVLLILGESMNLFDLLILDLCWFRNSRWVRFTKYQEPKYYKSMVPHLISFAKAVVMFAIVAAIDGALLMLF